MNVDCYKYLAMSSLYSVFHRQSCISGSILLISLRSAIFPCCPSCKSEQQWIQLKQGNVALSTKRGRIYRVERILQGICSILDTFIFTLNDWASYGLFTIISHFCLQLWLPIISSEVLHWYFLPRFHQKDSIFLPTIFLQEVYLGVTP